MAEATKTVVMPVPIDKIWDVIVDYEKYSEFVDGVHSVKAKPMGKGKTEAQYSLELLGKEIFYTLEHVENKPHEMSWHMLDSNIMKANTGGWTLKDLGKGKTEVTYRLALEFKIYVPGLVLNGLVKSTLPKMLENFERRAKEV